MKECRNCGLEKALPEFSIRRSAKDGLMSTCRKCNAAKTKAYAQANREKVKAYSAIWRSENKEKTSKYHRDRRINNLYEAREKDRVRYRDNRESVRARQKEYYQRNSGYLLGCAAAYRKENAKSCKENMAAYYIKNRERLREGHRKYYLANKDKFLGYSRARAAARSPGFLRARAIDTAKRRAKIKRAIPAWFDAAECAKLYEIAGCITRETGIKHEVDHIVPINSEVVCGLHWHGNMRVISKADNASKGNRHWPDMP